MVIKNKLAWSSIEDINRDFGSCLYDLQNFKMLYNREKMPILWERYIKEGFKNSAIVIETLRKLRNDDSHGYDIPEFEDMYELFIQNEETFVNIRNYCKAHM